VLNPLMDELGFHAAVLEYAKGFEARSGIQMTSIRNKPLSLSRGNKESSVVRYKTHAPDRRFRTFEITKIEV
jgi:hypothetical protein